MLGGLWAGRDLTHMLWHSASVFAVSPEICLNFYEKREVLRVLSYPDHQEKCGKTLTHVVDSVVVFYTCTAIVSCWWLFFLCNLIVIVYLFHAPIKDQPSSGIIDFLNILLLIVLQPDNLVGKIQKCSLCIS